MQMFFQKIVLPSLQRGQVDTDRQNLWAFQDIQLGELPVKN